MSLIASVTALLDLIFDSLNNRFPDALVSSYSYGYNSYDFSGMRNAIAVLVILFPVFLVLSRVWVKTAAKGLTAGDAVIRKWMLYLVIFLASIVVVTDLVTLVGYFVGGEITVRFITKVLSAFAVAGVAGAYYFFELSGEKIKKGTRALAAIVSTLMILVGIMYGFSIMGSPFKQRALRLDSQRVSDLQNIQSQVVTYWQQKSTLPVSLTELNNPVSTFSVPTDPELQSGRTYEYVVTGNTTFELCATFSLPVPTTMQMTLPGTNDSWNHTAGHTCYTRTIDPAMYPPFKNSVNVQ